MPSLLFKKRMADFNLFESYLKAKTASNFNVNDNSKVFIHRGITLAEFRKFFGQTRTKEDMLAMNEAQWRHGMKKLYWLKCKADKINSQIVAELFVDWYMDSGNHAVCKIQRVFGQAPSGEIDGAFLRALNNPDEQYVFGKIINGRISFIRKACMVGEYSRNVESMKIQALNYFITKAHENESGEACKEP